MESEQIEGMRKAVAANRKALGLPPQEWISSTDGGAAIPAPHEAKGYPKEVTLRDYFAAKAMQAIISKPDCRNYESDSIPKNAYMLADAMLAERLTD